VIVTFLWESSIPIFVASFESCLDFLIFFLILRIALIFLIKINPIIQDNSHKILNHQFSG
jgi:hypothetical protein